MNALTPSAGMAATALAKKPNSTYFSARSGMSSQRGGLERASEQRLAAAPQPLRHGADGAKPTAERLAERERHEKEAQILANLTGWQISEIRKAMHLASGHLIEEKKWYERLWNN